MFIIIRKFASLAMYLETLIRGYSAVNAKLDLLGHDVKICSVQ